MLIQAEFERFIGELRRCKRKQYVFINEFGLRRISAGCAKAEACADGDDYVGEFLGNFKPSVPAEWLAEDIGAVGVRLVGEPDNPVGDA